MTIARTLTFEKVNRQEASESQGYGRGKGGKKEENGDEKMEGKEGRSHDDEENADGRY